MIPVSPNSLYAYLYVIAFGLRGMKIEENAQRILESLAAIREDFSQFGDDFRTLGKHIQNAWSKHQDADGKMARLETRLQAIRQSTMEGADALPGGEEGSSTT